MLNEKELLIDVCKNAQMGVAGIREVLEVVKDKSFYTILKSQCQEYQNVYDEAAGVLARMGETPGEASLTARTMVEVCTAIKTLADRSPSKIAEIIIEGSTQGVMKMTKRLNEYTGPNGDAVTLAKKQIATEQANIEDMKAYL